MMGKIKKIYLYRIVRKGGESDYCWISTRKYKLTSKGELSQPDVTKATTMETRYLPYLGIKIPKPYKIMAYNVTCDETEV